MSARLNFYSDTQTLPTRRMIEAIAEAPLGDDMRGEDPTVNRLQERAAELTGMEAGLLVTSGLQGNLVSLMSHGGHGDEVFLDPDSHVYFYEGGSLCNIAGYTPRMVPAARGLMDEAALSAAVRPRSFHFPKPSLLWLENTHNRGGGAILSQDGKNRLLEVAKREGLKVHIDGARIFNASVASDIPVRELCEGADSVQFCLSKGLSCPVGSVVCGSREFISEAVRARKRLGGAMRQAGIIAACGLVALEGSWIERLGEDHRRARRLAELIKEAPGVKLDLGSVETNMVFVDINGWGVGSKEASKLLAEKGLEVSIASEKDLRLVTHRHITDEDVGEASEIFYAAGSSLCGC